MKGGGRHEDLPAEAGYADLIRRLYGSLARGDSSTADLIVREALANGLSASRIDNSIIGPAMERIGDAWGEGELGVAEEHRATEIAFRLLATLRSYERIPELKRHEDVVLATAVEGEQHVMGLRMAADVLDAAGFSVYYLGPDLPLDALGAAVRDFQPRAVALTATMPSAATVLQEAVGMIRAVDPGVTIVAGGAAVPPSIERLGANRLDDVTLVVERLDALLRRPELN